MNKILGLLKSFALVMVTILRAFSELESVKDGPNNLPLKFDQNQ